MGSKVLRTRPFHQLYRHHQETSAGQSKREKDEKKSRWEKEEDLEELHTYEPTSLHRKRPSSEWRDCERELREVHECELQEEYDRGFRDGARGVEKHFENRITDPTWAVKQECKLAGERAGYRKGFLEAALVFAASGLYLCYSGYSKTQKEEAENAEETEKKNATWFWWV